MQKIILQPFGIVQNHTHLMQQVPKIMERLIQVEVKINELIDYVQKVNTTIETTTRDTNALTGGALLPKSDDLENIPFRDGEAGTPSEPQSKELEKKQDTGLHKGQLPPNDKGKSGGTPKTGVGTSRVTV